MSIKKRILTSVIIIAIAIALFAVQLPTEVQLVKVKVLYTVGGDTFDVVFLETKNGFTKDTKERVRLIGVNAPETHGKVQFFGPEAAQLTKEVLTNKIVYLEFDKGLRDKYGRLLAYLWFDIPYQNANEIEEIKAKMYNAMLLLNGYAKALTISPNVKYQVYFRQFEAIAKSNKVGIQSEQTTK